MSIGLTIGDEVTTTDGRRGVVFWLGGELVGVVDAITNLAGWYWRREVTQ